ncbi:hypothetical protein Tdes44962_MAKER02900, partial [Teratosphaeria destructans]
PSKFEPLSSTPSFNHLFALWHPPNQNAITLRNDLHSMCIVSKDVKAVAKLYHTMEVTLGFLECNVHKVFDHGNEKLKHIRNLQIEPEGCLPWDTKFAPVFSKLLTALPKDRLHRFSILSSLEVVHEVSLLLQLRQRQMSHYQLFDHDSDHSSIADMLPTRSELANVTSVLLYVTEVEAARRANRILGACYPNLTRLHSELDGGVGHFFLLEDIFVEDSSWRDDAPSRRTLSHVGFGHISLTFFRCIDSAYVLGQLSAVVFKPTSLTLVNDGVWDSDEGSLDELLLSVSGLKYLRMSVRQDEDLECNSMSIMMQSESLRILYLKDPDGASDVGRDNETFRKMCLDCGKLEQLAFYKYYPYEHAPLGNGATLSRRAQKLANTMFNTLHGHCPSLKAIVIDVRAEDQEYDDHKAAIYSDTFCYFRKLRADILGKTTAAACAVSTKDIKCYVSHGRDTHKRLPAMTSLLELPAELRAQIAEEERLAALATLESSTPMRTRMRERAHLTSPSDLRSLCLACKCLHAVALPWLYHTADLSLSRPTIWRSAFRQSNPGLTHIRNLWLKNYRLGAQNVISIIQALPRDVLRKLHVAIPNEMLPELGLLLRLQQRQLETFQLPSYPVAPLLNAIPQCDELSNVTAIDLEI